MREVICKYCGAPIVDNADRCPYCKILYPQKAIAKGQFVDINIDGEIVHTYISDIETKTLYESARTISGNYIAQDIKRYRIIKLVEV